MSQPFCHFIIEDIFSCLHFWSAPSIIGVLSDNFAHLITNGLVFKFKTNCKNDNK